MTVRNVPSKHPKRRAAEEHDSGDARFKLIDRTLKRYRYQQDALIEVLHTAQEAFGFLEEDLLIYVRAPAQATAELGFWRGYVLSLLLLGTARRP